MLLETKILLILQVTSAINPVAVAMKSPPAMGNTVGCTIYYVSVVVKDRIHLLDLHSVVLIENDEIAAVMVSVRDQGVRVETDCQLGSQKSLKGALGRKHRRFSRAR